MNLFGINIPLSDFVPPILMRMLRNPNIKFNHPFVHEKLLSFSQYQEDVFIDAILEFKSKGFYIDIGANDPNILSNTKRFYLRGWSGINIEPNPDLHKAFLAQRPRDTNLNIGISSTKGTMEFFVMNPHTLSTFDAEAVIDAKKAHSASLVNKILIPTITLEDLFQQHATCNVDFLSIDTEGLDLNILQSNNWKKFRPYCIVVELYFQEESITTLLQTNGYILVYNNHTNGIFVDATK